MNELLNQLSAFELIELQTIYFDLANSTLTIFTTALFAYLFLCHVALDRLSKVQLIVITSLYSLFMLTQVLFLTGHFYNAHGIQGRMSTLFSDIPEGGNEMFYFVPAIAIVSWVVSILYMWSMRRASDT